MKNLRFSLNFLALKVFFSVLFLFGVLGLGYARETARIVVQKTSFLGEPFVNCEGLSHYLNSIQRELSFECLYLTPKEVLKFKPEPKDIFFINPPTFLELNNLTLKGGIGVFPLFTIYHSEIGWQGLQGAVIFTRSDSPIKELRELKRKKIGIVDSWASCYLLALYEFYKQGIPEEELNLVFTGSWEKVVEGVLQGKFEAGAVRTGILESLFKHKKLDPSQVKVLNQRRVEGFPFLLSTELIPDWFLVYHERVDPKILKALSTHLYPLVEEGKNIPNTNLKLGLPRDPYLLLEIMKRLYKGPFSALKEEIKKKQMATFVTTVGVSLAVLTIFIFLVVNLLRLNRRKNKLLKELAELNANLNEMVDLKTRSLEEALSKLKLETERFSLIFREIDVGLCLVDTSSLILEANPKASELLGVENLKGERLCSFLKIPQEEYKALCYSVDKNSPIEFEINYVRDDGKSLPLLVKVFPVGSLDNHQMLVMLVDLTTQKKLQQEAIELSKHEALRAIASGLAHDLNNLLSAMANNIELILLKSRQIPDEVRPHIERIKATCFKAKTLTSELLVLGKGLVLNPKSERLSEIIKEVAELTLSGSGVVCHYHFDDKDTVVSVDKASISIAIANLILNAKQAMNDRGDLYLTTKSLNGEVMIEIRDTGPGIPEEIKDKLFQPFVTTKPGGSGLGLFSTKRIVEANSGRITIESEPGKGTTVRVYLPKGEVRKLIAEEIKKSQQALETSPAKKRILLMDDEAEVRESLVELLKELGHDVIACETGEEAIEVYRSQGPFDLVILDYVVPGKWNGIETFREIAKIDPQVKAILATGYSESTTVSSYLKEGLKAILLKPFSLEELKNIIATL